MVGLRAAARVNFPGELLMRESPSPERGQPPQRQRGKVISMPTPIVVRRRRYIRLGMALLGVVLVTAIVGRVYLTTRLPQTAEQIAGVSEEELEPGFSVAVRRDVTMLLSTGTAIDGTILVDDAAGHERLSDYARDSKQFWYVLTSRATVIVNSAHIVEIVEKRNP